MLLIVFGATARAETFFTYSITEAIAVWNSGIGEVAGDSQLKI